MKFESKLWVGDRFFRYNINTSSPQADFVPCEKCEGKGFFSGSGGRQQHPCRACASVQRYYPLVPAGYVADREFRSTGPFPLVIYITRETVWSLAVTDGEGGAPEVTYVYDSDYDGDLHIPERDAYDSWEAALDAAQKHLVDYPQHYHMRGDPKGVIQGVIFMNEIES